MNPRPVSLRLGALRLSLRLVDRALFQRRTPLPVLRAAMGVAALTGRAPRGTRYSRGEVNGVGGLWVRPPGVTGDALLLYLHGGGYCGGSARSYRKMAASLAANAGTTCFVPDYRLAPEARFPAAADDVLAVYEGLLADGCSPGRILLAGDSAGGGLALGLVMAVRDRGLPAPAAVGLISPWLDLSGGERDRGSRRPVFGGAMLAMFADYYTDAETATSTGVSPLRGDLAGLPPLYVQSAQDDLLADDAGRLVARAAERGVPVPHREFPGLWHGFHMMNRLVPAADIAVAKLAAELASRLAPARLAPARLTPARLASARPAACGGPSGGGPPPGGRRPEVAIVGGGASGICLGALLSRADLADYTIYEKAPELGGTWRDNVYPGLTCDVPSRLYCYSFTLEPSWTRLFAPGREINRYLNKVARDHGLDRHVRLNTHVTSAAWVDGRWQLETSTGPRGADILVTATGVLHHPVIPEIPGLDRFRGDLFHSARWDSRVAIEGRRVAVIGTGSSGVQIVSAVAGTAARLLVFQRTPAWTFPAPNPRYSDRTRRIYRRWPWLCGLSRRGHRRLFELLAGSAPLRPGLGRLVFAAGCRAHLRLAVRDPELRRRLRPKDRIMCKRLIVSGTFYRALQRPGVTVVNTPIAEITEDGIRTADGAHHPVDVIVLATGFDARAFVRPLEVTGIDGADLGKAWADGPVAYRSVALPGFPNFFMMLGPFSPKGNQSLLSAAETQAGYIMRWITTIARGSARIAVMPTAAATERFVTDARAALRHTSWTSGCASYYLGASGAPVLWPWSPRRYRRDLREPVESDFEFLTI